MANQAFDYDLLISVGEAEKRIAQFAKTIERELGSSVEKAFKGSFDFDISPIQRKIKEIESQVKTLGQTFKGSFDFDVGPQAQKMDFLITKAQQLADAVGGNSSNAPWMRMQRRMEQVTRLSEELRANFTDPFSMTAINQLESKLRAISEDLKGKKTGSFSEAREWDKAFADARADFDKGAPARQAAASKELSQAINAANQLHDLEVSNSQELDAMLSERHSKRMKELQQEVSAKEAAKKLDYQERVSQSQTDITSADERRMANQARITKVFEAEFKRREDLDLEIAARVDSIKTKYLEDQAARQAAADRELQRAIVAANQLHDLEMRNNQELAAAQEASHNKRMRELQQEASAKEASDKVNYQEKVSQSQTDITSADERRIANQARITKVFEAEFKRREQLDLEIEARVNNIKSTNLKDQADLVKKNAADKLKAEQDYLQSVEDGQNRIRGEEIQEAESQKKRLEDRKRYTEKFLESGKVGTEKQVQANDRMHERLLRGIQNLTEADKRRYSGLHHFETLIGEVHQKYEAEAKQLILERDALGEREFNNRMQQLKMLHSAEREFAQREATNATNQDLARFAGGGRAVSNMFEVQQAFEDFQYAGLRGAANNIAMMAANMGGSGGIIALGAIMGAQLAASAGLWDTLNESLNGFLWKLKSVTEEEEKQNNLAKARFDSQRDAFKQRLEYQLDNYESLSGKATKEKENIDNLRAEVQQVREAAGAYKQMAEQAKILESIMPTGWTGSFGTSPEETADAIYRYKQLLQSPVSVGEQYTKDDSGRTARQRISDAITYFELNQKHFEATANGMSLTEEGQKALTDREKEYVAELTKANSEYKTTLQLVEEMQQAFAELGRIQNKTYGSGKAFSSDGLSGRFKKSFEYDADQSKTLIEKAKAEAKIAAESIQDSYAAEITAARKAGLDQKALDLAKEMDDKIRDQRHSVEDLIESESRRLMGLQQIAKEGTEALEKLSQLHKSVTSDWKEQLSLGERQLSNLNQLIQADEQRLRALEDQASAFEDATEKQSVSLQAKQIAHEASLEKDAYQESMRLGKEAFQNQVDYIKEISRQRYEYMKRHNEKGKGDSNPDVTLTEQYNRWKQEFDSWVNYKTKRNEEADRKRLKQIERQGELEVKAKYKDYADAQKVKEDQLRKEAQDAEMGGDLIKADQRRKQLDKLLKERADAAAQQVGKGTKEEGKKAYEEWQAYNDKIIANNNAHAEVIKARQEQNLGTANTLSIHLENMRDAMEEMSQLTIGSDDTEARLQGYLETLNMMKEAMAETARLSSLINPGGGGASTPVGRGMPAYAEGTPYVPRTGVALIHKGEMIIPASEAKKMRDTKSQQFSGSDEYNVKSARYKHSQAYLQVQDTFGNTKSSLITQRNSGNVDAGRGLVEFRLEVEKGLSILEQASKEIRKYEEAIQKQTSDRRKMSEKARHDAAMADIREKSSRGRLEREASAQRIRKLEEKRQANLDRLNAGPESTPDYIARRRNEIVGRKASINKGWLDGYDERQKINDPESYDAHRNLGNKVEELGTSYTDLQSRIVDEIEKTHKMVNETKEKVTDAGHEREKMHQNKKAGLDLENQGWKQKHSGGEGGSFRTGDGEYISPESQALEMRQEAARKRAEQLKRARRLSGQSPSQVEQGDVQDAMKLEQQLQSSAQQKAILERLEAVKASEVGQANALASALERAAAAKAALASTGSGGYGATGAGVSGGRSGGAGGGVGGGPSTVINNNMTGVMNNASPQAVFAAMQTAAQISSIRRS